MLSNSKKKRELLFQPWVHPNLQEKRAMTEPFPSKGELNFAARPKSVDFPTVPCGLFCREKKNHPTFFHFWCVMRCVLLGSASSNMGIPSPNPPKTGFGSNAWPKGGIGDVTIGCWRPWKRTPGTQPLGGRTSEVVTFPTKKMGSAPKKFEKKHALF